MIQVSENEMRHPTRKSWIVTELWMKLFSKPYAKRLGNNFHRKNKLTNL